jgi:hypothetical protein
VVSVGRAAAVSVLVAGVLLAVGPAGALETDQFYAWGRPLEDATDVLNAKVNAEIILALERINGRGAGKTCHKVVGELKTRYVWFIFQDIELWALNTPLLSRIPATSEEEIDYRRQYLYHQHGPLDIGTSVPPSPTIEAGGVRFGTDKLAHFFSEGFWYYRWYHGGRKKGLSREEAELRAIRKGAFFEQTILGLASSGVLSLADLEANYQGMRFYAGLCEGETPGLTLGEDGWRLARPFDIRDHVSPEWDESWQPSIFGRRRWRKVRPVMLDYCSKRDDPWVIAQRDRYRRLDRTTVTEQWVKDRVEQSKLTDPWAFTLDSACAEAGVDEPPAQVAEDRD